MIDKNSTLYYKFNKMKEFVRHINMAEVALEAFEDEEILSWKKHFIKSELYDSMAMRKFAKLCYLGYL